MVGQDTPLPIFLLKRDVAFATHQKTLGLVSLPQIP